MSPTNEPTRKPRSLRSFFLPGMVLLLLFWGANILLTRWTGGNADPEEAARAEFRIRTLAELRASNARKLDEYAWVNRTNGSVQIPIQQAMELILPQLNSSHPRPAYPVATPVATPTAQPAVAAPPATPSPFPAQ
ncbi:MAG: hypothetical protein WCQ16_07050 [Verrucomicrobiae bacterium]